jgi:two-component system, LytTR family, response regulator
MKTILIDDEPLALNRLQRLLSKYPHVFQIIGEAKNGQEGLEMIEKLKPDVIFLDIEMPLLNGFQMLAKLTHQPIVIFATAFEEYAIRAFEEYAIDYLLKPIEEERLQKTIQKLQNQIPQEAYSHKIYDLLNHFQPKKEMTSITVKLGDRILLVRLEEITYLEAEDKYVYVHTIDHKKHLIDESLTSLEEKLPDYFIRISRSNIVNTNHIQELQKYFNSKLILVLNDASKTKLTSGTSYYAKLKSYFEF